MTITSYSGNAKTLIIPAEIEGLPVAEITAGAIRNQTNLTSITIPNTVTRIGAEAFRDCTALTSITIPDSVTSFGEPVRGIAFEKFPLIGCTNLTSVIIGNGITSIANEAFEDFTKLTADFGTLEHQIRKYLNRNAETFEHQCRIALPKKHKILM